MPNILKLTFLLILLCSFESRISMRAKIRNGSISHAQLIESLPDEDAKANDLIAQDILKATSYLLNTHCKTTDITSKDCVKFLSKYSLPESRLSKKCLAPGFRHRAYRRLLPPSYQDGLQKVRPERRKENLILIVRFLDTNCNQWS